MLRQVIALFDEYQSKETAKHVLRSMKENARQGFWNGSQPPYGYRPIEVEQRGARVKKKLVIDDVEAEQVQLIFRLFAHGDGTSGPKGVKAVVRWLNEHGHRTRHGARWGIGPCTSAADRYSLLRPASVQSESELHHALPCCPRGREHRIQIL